MAKTGYSIQGLVAKVKDTVAIRTKRTNTVTPHWPGLRLSSSTAHPDTAELKLRVDVLCAEGATSSTIWREEGVTSEH